MKGFERLNHITSDCMLSEKELDEISSECMAAQACRFGFIDYSDALDCIKEASESETKEFENGVKNRDANKVGELVLRFIDEYAEQCAKGDIAEKVNERLQELKPNGS